MSAPSLTTLIREFHRTPHDRALACRAMRPVAAVARFLRGLPSRGIEAPTRPVSAPEAAKAAAWRDEWHDRERRLDELRARRNVESSADAPGE